ncbi:Phosphatidylethanolamine-binding protein PEBP [Cordyceps fumosorosea ARSEF 2679]|uniref:Phosphatidylethanolamine-binding protein PEBP n=1 Tax=Cordyceps fumosorosea (strain ARSEF 2679) TaxID=1081104 RepID=A0A167Q0I0_CORFA|nr:Phosphatidylethanolamine-binding protein PEBP [Cordyceps fumosorosea ARSEF 2679]OAA57180.1 Phosphatidylethanolamine-binding protein PEBP [Cordyceps fumosorosea ARSEF 2679]
MSGCRAVSRPLTRQLRPQCVIRTLTSSAVRASETTTSTQEPTASTSAAPLDLDPNTVPRELEQELMDQGTMPIGSRRRREAIRTTGGLPFEQLPYQAFQEARKILAADRATKVASLQATVDKITALEAADAVTIKGGETMKQIRLRSLRKEAHRLTILADINDPLVKRRFEDGLGDMTKPIYRHLAEKKWRAYDYKLIAQRIEQFSIVPDILPKLDPVVDVRLYFDGAKVPPGAVVPSDVSERAPPRLRVQAFDDRGERLVTVVVVDADVPDLAADGFLKRCHYVAANIPVSPSLPGVALPLLTESGSSDGTAGGQVAVSWLPPHATKGSPYHRMGVFVLEQGAAVDVAKLKELYAHNRDGFSLKSFRDKFSLSPVGFGMFRSEWDEHTANVMARHELEGADMELRPRRVYSLKPPVRPRGWEAKHQSGKYRHLDKYTKRIKGISNARGWTKRR